MDLQIQIRFGVKFGFEVASDLLIEQLASPSDTPFDQAQQMASNSWTASPRLRGNLVADDSTAEGRRTSNHSSTSSDILVASAHPGMPTPQVQPSEGYLQQSIDAASTMASKSTIAIIVDGHILRATFGDDAAKEKFRVIVQTTPQPQASMLTSAYTDSDDEEGNENESKPDADAHGLDPLKTYSKEETLRHPEVNFVHRGQGRYRMADAIKNLSLAVVQRSTRYEHPLLCEQASSTDHFIDMLQSLIL